MKIMGRLQKSNASDKNGNHRCNNSHIIRNGDNENHSNNFGNACTNCENNKKTSNLNKNDEHDNITEKR